MFFFKKSIFYLRIYFFLIILLSMLSIHLHQKLLIYLDEQIRSGKYRPGDVLPSDLDLAHAQGVSVATVRRAYSELVNRGWVRRVKKTRHCVERYFVAVFQS